MLEKRGNSTSYLRMFYFVFLILIIAFVFFIPDSFFSKLGFGSKDKGSNLLLSPDENSSIPEVIPSEVSDQPSEVSPSSAENNSIASQDSGGNNILSTPEINPSSVDNTSTIESQANVTENNATSVIQAESNATIDNNATVENNVVGEQINATEVNETGIENGTIAEFNVTETNVTNINVTESNLTGANITENNVTEINVTKVNLIEGNATVISRIVVGVPVKWKKEVTVDAEGGSVSLPKEADNIVVRKSGEEISLSPAEERGSLLYFLRKLFYTFTGRATQEIVDGNIIDTGNSKEVVIEQGADYSIEYTTPAPSVKEEEIGGKKRVTVSGPDLGYENILAFTSIPESLNVGEDERIMVYWVEQKSYEQFSAYDSDGNGLLDYIEWNVPHLSNQSFDIILITKAEHLDGDRGFVSDIYGQVKERDGSWSETIPDGDYVRVTFEQLLDNTRDISLYPKVISGAPRIEVYENGKGQKIAEFESLTDDMLNKIFLTNLVGEQDTFDLKVVGGDVEFDYIVDPIVSSNYSDSMKNNVVTEAYPLSHIALNDSSLVLYMPFDVNNTNPKNVTYDYSQYNNDGTTNRLGKGFYWNSTGGIYGGYYSWNNTPQTWIDTGEGDYLENITAFTVSVWIKRNSSGADDIISKFGGGTDTFFLQSSGSTITFRVWNEIDASSFATQTGVINDNMWHHVVGVLNGASLVTYIDNLVGTAGAFSGIKTADGVANLLIGDDDQGSAGWNGSIDEVMVWNRSLSASEVSTIYNSQFYRYITPATQLFTNISLSQDGTINRVNVTTNSTLLQGSALNLRLQEFDSSGANIENTSWQNLISGDNQVLTFTILTTAYNVTLEFNYSAGGNFYSPILRDIIDVASWAGGGGGSGFTPLTSCGILSSANTVYVLQNNINNYAGTCFNITANNITLDGNGFSIDGDNVGTDYGIYAFQRANVTIKNLLNITEFVGAVGAGIYFGSVNNSFISNLGVSSDTNGIYLSSSSNNQLNNITANSNSNGVLLDTNSSYNRISNITVNSNNYGVIVLNSSNNNLTGITAKSNSYSISLVADSKYNQLSNIIASSSANGIYLSSSSNNQLNNLTASSDDNGIFLNTNSNYNIISNITANSNNHGVVILNSSNNNLTGIIANSNNFSISLATDSKYNQLSNIIANSNLYGIVLSSDSNNSIIHGSINNSGQYAIIFDAGTSNDVITNISITNTNSSFKDIYFDIAGINGTQFVDMPPIGNYSFSGAGGIITVRKTGVGEIRFLQPVNGSGDNFDADIEISNNRASVRSNINPGLNRSANITFFGLPTALINPQILRDGLPCGNSCYNLTSLNAGTVVFNVTSWTSYTIDGVPLPPQISFVPPTPNDAASVIDHAIINVSIMEDILSQVKFNWDGTNSSLYDDSLVLFMNFDNNSLLGENDSIIKDLSRYGNDGKVIGLNWTSSGRYGGAYYFPHNLGDHYVNISGNSSLDISGKGISIGFWIKPLAPTSDVHNFKDYVIVNKPWNFGLGQGIPPYQYSAEIYNGAINKFVFIMANFTEPPTPLESMQFYSNTNASYGVWQHAVVTYNGTSLKWYVNGLLDANISFNGDIIPRGKQEPLILGIDSNFVQPLNGTLDELMIWNRSLSDEEVKQLYFSNLRKYNPTQWYLLVDEYASVDADYDYFACAKDFLGNENCTETRTVNIDVQTSSLINFNYPTPINGDLVNKSLEINASMIVGDMASTKFNWNGTNYSHYDNSLLVMMNFDNRSILGENDNFVRDLGIHGNDGVFSNNLSRGEGADIGFNGIGEGRYEKGVYFDGDTDYVKINNSGSLIGMWNLSYSLWVKVVDRNTTGAWDVLVSKGAVEVGANGFGLLLGPSGDNKGRLFSYFGGGSEDDFVTSPDRLPFGEWVFATVTVNQDNLASGNCIYINGKLSVCGALTNHVVGDKNITLGASFIEEGAWADEYFEGGLDEFRLWNRTLSASEVQEQYYTNLYKYNLTQWYLYENRKDYTAGHYNFFACVSDGTGESCTETRNIDTEPFIPLVSFVNPTPDNNSFVKDNIEINTSIVESNLKNISFYSGGNNFSFYDESLYIMANFNNVSSLGEDGGSFVNLAGKEDKGKIYGANVTNATQGKYGNGIYFDGVNDYARIPYSLSSPLIDLSYSLWVKRDVLGTGNWDVLVSKGAVTVGGFGLLTKPSGVQQGRLFSYFNGGNFVLSPDRLPFGEWAFVTVTINQSNTGSGNCIYFNGKLSVCEALTPGEIFPDSFTLGGSLRSEGAWENEYFNGYIDEFRFWNRTLTSEEVQEQYYANLYKSSSMQWNLYINQSNLNSGLYSFQVFTADVFGNSNATDLRTVNVASAPPVVNLTYPSFGAKISTANYSDLNFSLSSSDNAKMEFWVYGTNGSADGIGRFLLYHRTNVSNGDFYYKWMGRPVDPLSNKLVALYHFDNNSRYKENDTFAYDFSGRGNNASVKSGASYNETGYFAGAYNFNGVDGYMNVSDSSSLRLRSNFTIAAWIRPYTLGAAGVFKTIVIKEKEDVGGYRYGLQLNGAEISAGFTSGSGGNCGGPTANTYTTSGAGLQTNTWQHVAAVFDDSANTFKIYLNGVQKFSTAVGANVFPCDSTNHPLLIGRTSGGEYFNGQIDELAIWNRTLSAQEIKELAVLTSGRYYWQVNVSDGNSESTASSFFKFLIPPFTNNLFINTTYGTNTTNENLTCYADVFDDPNADEYERIYWKWYNGSTLFSQGTRDMRTETENDSSMVVFMHLNNDSSFGENDTFIYDFSGRGNNATAVCGTGGAPCPSVVNGTFGKAFNFTFVGSAADQTVCTLQNDNTHLVIKDSNDLSIQPNFTISAWIYYINDSGAGYVTDDHEIVTHSGGGADIRYTFGITDDSGRVGRLRFDYMDPNKHSHYGNSVITPYKWHYVALVRNGDRIIFYIDGNKDADRSFLVAVGDPKTLIINPPFNMWIGESGETQDCNEGWNGMIDELAIWNKSLSDEDVFKLYQRGKGVNVINNLSSINAEETAIGNIWNCTVFSSNGNDNETQNNSANIRILGATPLRIKDVEIGDNQNIAPGKMKDIIFSVIVESSDLASVNLLNASFDFGGINRTNSSCSMGYNLIDAVTANFSCTIGIWYFDSPGLWNVTAFVKDDLGQFGFYNETFNLASDVFCDNNETLGWTGLSPGDTNILSDDIFSIRNTGNVAFPPGGVQMNSSDLYGEDPYSSYIIPASNFFVNSVFPTCGGIQMVNKENVDITSVFLDVGNNSAGIGVQNLTFCIDNVPIGLPGTEYKAVGVNSWQILCSDFTP